LDLNYSDLTAQQEFAGVTAYIKAMKGESKLSLEFSYQKLFSKPAFSNFNNNIFPNP